MWVFGVVLLCVSCVRGADELAIAFAESSVTPDVLSVAPSAVLNMGYRPEEAMNTSAEIHGYISRCRQCYVGLRNLFTLRLKDPGSKVVVWDGNTDALKNQNIDVKYPTGVEANLGNELTPTDVRLPPLVSWNAEPGVYYTLVLVDPDAPSRKNPEAREFLHWLVGNIQGNDLGNAQTIAEYLPSAPPKDSGLHRYVMLLFRQPTRINFSSEPIRKATSTRDRAKFSVQNFARQYNLDVPLNGNFYVSKYDSIVPNIHKTLVD